MMRCASWLGVSIAVCVALCLFPGSVAHAWFNDVTDSYPASQDVPTSGSPLTGADIPEGVYNITASTSSYMCKLSNVTLTSSGGGLWATFTMSGAYNALYLGTAEAAAAATNEDGTDVSAYYISDPLEGYVSRQFSIPIDALNLQITLATYSGGSKGNKDGMWYTRTVVFNSSAEVEEAIASGTGDDSGDDSGGNSGGDGGDPGGDGGDDSGGYDGGDDSGGYDDGGDSGGNDDGDSGDYYEDETGGYDGDDTGDYVDEDESSDDDYEEPDSSQSGAKGGVAPTSEPEDNEPDDGQYNDNGSDGDEPGDGEEGDEEADEEVDEEADEEASDEEAEAEAEADQVKGGGARMREIKFEGNQVVELGEGDKPDLQQKEVESSNAQQAGAVAAGALGAINVALAGAYVVGLRRARPQLFTKAAEKISSFRRK